MGTAIEVNFINKRPTANSVDIERLERLALKAAAEDTCDPLLIGQWRAYAPHAGHSRLFALLVEHLYGGMIVYCRHIDHYFNKISGGTIVDIAHSEISREAKDPCIDRELSRAEVAIQKLNGTTVKEHYDVFWKRFSDALAEEEKGKIKELQRA